MSNIYEALPTPTSTRLICLRSARGSHCPSIQHDDAVLDTVAISTSLQLIDLEAEYPDYVPLSYTWGTDELTHPIVCNGEAVFITANLHSALRRLRGSDEDLWM